MPRCERFVDLLQGYAAGERSFQHADLDNDPNNSLNGICLDGIDLSGSFIVASFQSTSLRNAVFSGANVKTCDFTDADLSGADFRNAALCATTFARAKMEGARFTGAFYHSHVLADNEQPNW